ncbi:Fur family peroxide stress response transcriptional regulator [Natranaerovirga hydrolytica]|uniref:Fur family peroxide stress response transcriptional regulator n=1 Tax=Natranaerovirga hydrolytica TaxID=680378 RepID=A0A4R1MGJ8_9FIRM|nr:Fur family transcriptional regulator [Natranaerovirga hydrolytica]TCK89033.1 Fur family peroxide stress response transcriptional regulator [Natranaerovirga hydrolytica]
MEKLAEMLKAKKLKVTPQRLAIFGILYNTRNHPSAETIYKALQPTHPTMSLATVYKTLDTLKKSDLVEELNVGEDSFRYDATISPHPHAICLKCNSVEDLDTKVLDNITSEIQDETDFDIISEKLYFYGYCKKCKTSK